MVTKSVNKVMRLLQNNCLFIVYINFYLLINLLEATECLDAAFSFWFLIVQNRHFLG